MTALVLLGAAAVAAAVGVVTARNVVHSVLWLIAHFVMLAAIFLTLSAEFIALIQILVNAGAVMVLFLFVISLLGPSKDTADLRARLSGGQSVLLAVLAVILIGTVAALAGASPGAARPAAAFGSVGSVGAALFGPQLLPFELAALVLLVAIVSVVVLAGGAERP